MLGDDLETWADDHGYQQYRCPGCHQLYYSDSGPVGNCSCGWMPNDEEDEGEDDEQGRQEQDEREEDDQ
jgi:hypothetical protein